MRRARAQDGQAAAELVAVAPILICVLLALGQLAVAGYALWTAGNAARAGARAAHVGGDAEGAARSALPSPLREGATVNDEDEVGVRVRVPSLIPGLPRVPLEASAALTVGDEGG